MRGRCVALFLISLFIGSACGSRLPANVLSSIDARSSSGTNAAGEGITGPLDGNPTAQDRTGTATRPGVTGGGTSPGSVTGGGSDAGGGSSAAATTQCDKFRSGSPGVTDNEIKVASIVTDSGPLPGATEGSYRGAASYMARVNAMGGLCGRQIRVIKGDDGLDPAKGRSEFERLEPSVFAFVGSFAVADSGYIDLIKSTGVPYVSLTVDPSGNPLRNVMPKTTRDRVGTGPFVWWKKTHPKVSKAAMLYAQIGGVIANVPGFQAAIKRAGFDLVYSAGAQVTSPDYTPEVRQAQDEGIQFFYLFAFEVNMHVRMIRNMRQQNYDPPIKGANIAYNTRFSQLLSSQGDGWENHQTHLQFLDPSEPSRSSALKEFIDWDNRLFPGQQLDLFPVSGWANSALFVAAMKHLKGGVISREALLDALYKETAFDGGGIQTLTDPRTGLGRPCFNVAIHKGGHWVREYPANALYECGLGENYKFK